MKFNVKATSLLLSILLLFVFASAVIAQDTEQGVKLSVITLTPQYQIDKDLAGRGWGIMAEKQINQSDSAPLSICVGYISYNKTTLAITDDGYLFDVKVNALQIPVLLKATISQGKTYVGVGAGAVYTKAKAVALGERLGSDEDTVFCYQVTGGLKLGTAHNLFVEAGYFGNRFLPGYTLAIGGSF
jgi:opacity protein-like surface antigen